MLETILLIKIFFKSLPLLREETYFMHTSQLLFTLCFSTVGSYRSLKWQNKSSFRILDKWNSLEAKGKREKGGGNEWGTEKEGWEMKPGNALCVGLPREGDIRKASETSHSIWVKPVTITVYLLHKHAIPPCAYSTLRRFPCLLIRHVPVINPYNKRNCLYFCLKWIFLKYWV